MPVFNDVYSYNLNNELTFNGQQTVFLDFKNIIDNSINTNNNLFIIVIPEFLNNRDALNSNNDVLKDVFYINTVDLKDLNILYKDSLNFDDGMPPANPVTSGGNSLFNFFGHYFKALIDYSGNPDIYKLGLKFFNNNFKLKLNSSLNTGFIYSKIYQNSNYNIRLDYTGNDNCLVKLNVIITNIDLENDTNALDKFPFLYTSSPSSQKDGDVYFDGNQWLVYDSNASGFVTFLSDDVNINYSDPLVGPFLGVKNLHFNGFYNDPSNYFLDYQEFYIFCNKLIPQRTKRDLSYVIQKETDLNYIDTDNSSSLLLRTNPLLTGNIKFVVDSSEKMYLETIDATPELNNVKYKNYKINPLNNYTDDLKKFLSGIPNDVLFYVKEDELGVKKTFDSQYNMFYSYGSSYLNSRFYKEKFKMFAPLHINKNNLPDYFVIFKVDGAISNQSFLSDNYEDIIKEILNNSMIIKTYSFKEGTPLGDYLRNYLNDTNYKDFNVFVNWSDRLSYYYGIDYNEGVVTQKADNLRDNILTIDNPIINFNEYITLGFKRNNLIATNIINFEFLFDDDYSDYYTFNRYFGLYVKENVLSKFKVYSKGFQKLINQLPIPKKDVEAEVYTNLDFVQKNDDGIIIPVDDSLNIIDNLNDDDFVNRFLYVKGKSNELNRVKSIKKYEFGNNPNSESYAKFKGLKLYYKTKNITDFTGIDRLVYSIDSDLLDGYKTQLLLVIDKKNELDDYVFLPGEVLEIKFYNNELNETTNWQIIANKTGLDIGDAWDYPIYNTVTNTYVNTFNPKGSVNDVSNAIYKCFKSFVNRPFELYIKDNKILITYKDNDDLSNSLIFNRYLVEGSYINNIKFYDDINPKYDVVYNKIYNGTSNGDFDLIIVNGVNGNYDVVYDYKVEVINYNTTSVTVKIYKNNGLYNTHTFYQTLQNNYNDGFIELKVSDYSLSNFIFNVGDVYYFNFNKNITQHFVGGTKRKRNSAIISLEDFNHLKKFGFDLLYAQSKKGMYKKLKNFLVGNDYIYGLYDVIDGNVIWDKRVIQLSDKSLEFYYSNLKKIMFYTFVENDFGVLSVLPSKDIDFDFYSNEYGYSHYAELFNYYDKIILKKNDFIEIDINDINNYVLTKGKIAFYYLNGYPFPNINDYILDATGGFKFFNSYLFNYNINYFNGANDCFIGYTPINNQSSNLLLRSYKNIVISKLKIKALDDSEIYNSNYYYDASLNNFKGFTGLSDFVSRFDLTQIEKMINERDINRFFFKKLKSEYDRLLENYNKDLVTKSRITPYICKFVYKDGTDSLDNYYSLNNSLAFGNSNLSPNIDYKNVDPEGMTNEFYYIDSFPFNYPIELFKNSRNYLYARLDDVAYNNKTWYELLTSYSDSDIYTKFLSFGYPNEFDYENNKIKGIRVDNRYVYLNYIEGDGFVNGLFKGVKFRVLDLDPITKNVLENSKRFDGYKFSIVLSVNNQSLFKNDLPSIEVISNNKFKTLLIIIKIYLNDYKIKRENYGYLELYTSLDALRDVNLYKNDSYFDVNNDYLKMNMYNDLYFFRGSSILDYADIKLTQRFDFKNAVINTSTNSISFSINNDLNVIDPTKNQVNPINYDKYMKSKFYVSSAGKYSNPYIKNLYDGRYSFLSQYYDDSLKQIQNFYLNGFNENSGVVDYKTDINPIHTNFMSVNNYLIFNTFTANSYYGLWSLATNIDNDVVCHYIEGGDNYNSSLDFISYSNIYKLFNNKSNLIKYKEILEDGSIKDGDFLIQFLKPEDVVVNNQLIPVVDKNVPDVYKDKKVIGYELNQTNNYFNIKRYNGFYNFKLIDVFNFYVREEDKLTNYYNKDFLLRNTVIDINNDFYKIKNLIYFKVSDDVLLKQNLNYYPLIDDVFYDKKDFNIFNSNWDNNYYVYYDKNNIKKLKEGSYSLYEKPSYFGSKMIKTKNNYKISVIDKKYYNAYILDPSKSKNNLFKSLSGITHKNLIIEVDIYNLFIDYLINDGFLIDFINLKNNGVNRFKNLSDDELLNLAKDYIKLNLIQLYNIKSIDFYSKGSENLVIKNAYDLVNTSFNSEDKIINGFKINKNVKFEIKDMSTLKIIKEIDNLNKEIYTFDINIEFI